jgi:type I restriction enzyme S subunit
MMSGRKATTNLRKGDFALSVCNPESLSPIGWHWIELNSIATMATGHTPSRRHPEYWGGEIKWIRAADARKCDGSIINDTKETINQLGIDNSAAVVLPKNTVCLSRSASIGYTVILGEEMATNQGFVNWICGKELEPKFLQYIFVLENSFLKEIAYGTAHTTIYYPEVKAFYVCIPPIDEQKRIVAKLDECFEAIDKARANVGKNLNNAKELFQSQLNQIFSQKGDGWVEKELGELCEKIQDGAHHSPKIQYEEKLNNRYLYITSKNIRNNYLDLSNVSYVDESFHNTIYPRCNPEAGDILITKDGANTGNITLNTLEEPFSLLSSVCLIKTNRKLLLPSFLKGYIQSPVGFKNITGKMTGMAIKRIILKTIKQAEIPLPDLNIQQQIVEQLDDLYEKTQSLESNYQQELDALDELKKSILQKAFNGEL